MPGNSRIINPPRAPGFDERVKALPLDPGVYIMRNRANEIIYVGKARKLRNRVRTYFGSLRNQAPKVWRMVENVYDFEYIVTETELEALILESELIKKHRPRYNIKLKDDKSYPFIRVTIQEEWPRVIAARRKLNDGAAYFGPFPGITTINDTIDLLDKLFPFRTCDKEITGKDPRPCMEYFIHRCLGPCASLADKQAYGEAINQVTLFLEGKQDKIVKSMRKEMLEASEKLEFERAAVFRDRIKKLEGVLQTQKVFSATNADEDVIAFAQEDGEAVVQVFFIRGGKLRGREHYPLEGTEESDPAEIMTSFIAQFYSDAVEVPPRLLLQHDISEADIIQSWLRQKRGTKVTLSVPQRGDKRALVDMAARNAAETLEQLRLRWLSDEQRATAALTELQEALRLPAWPKRIECYDVAHLQGTDTAGAMVVFEQGVPQKKEYRRFQIKTSGNDDFASMREMLSRRFKRAGVERAAAKREETLARAGNGRRDEPTPGDFVEATSRLEGEEHGAQGDVNLGDSVQDLLEKGRAQEAAPVVNGGANWTGWSVLPDLVVIDGGKGQLSSAQQVMREAGLLDVPMIGLAKREEEVFMPDRSEPLRLSERSEGLRLLQRIRDEAHRFSNTYNKKLGSKRGIRSQLDSVPLIGPRRKKELMLKFGSLRAIRSATVEELLEVPGMDRAAAQSLKEHL
ncbi:MAG: excinuclease ABC subunit UvrC [Chloroflexia bacterium]